MAADDLLAATGSAFIVHITDLHCGHRWGLMNPESTIYDPDVLGQAVEYTPKPSKIQEYLWHDVYMPGIEKTMRLVDGADVLLISGGDCCHGNKHPDQLVSNRIADQFVLAADAIAPWLKYPNVKWLRMNIGTAAHNFGEGSSTMTVARYLMGQFPHCDVQLTYHGDMVYKGFAIDYAHHGPGTGIRQWTNGNVARHYLRDIMLRDVLHGKKPPDLVLRGHVHAPAREIVTMLGNGKEADPLALESDYIESRLYITPAMCFISDYARQSTKSLSECYNGFNVFEVRDGKLIADNMGKFFKRVDIRTKEVID